MALHKTRAVVIGRRAFGESDRLVDFYTREYGKVRGIARAARRPRSRFGSALELFTLGEMVFFDSGRSELVQVDHFDIVRPFVRVREHLERLGQGAWAVEMVARLSADRDPHPALFALLVRALAALELTRRPARVSVCFGLRAVDLLGHRPRLDRCVACGRPAPFPDAALDVTAGGLVCAGCRPGADAMPLSGGAPGHPDAAPRALLGGSAPAQPGRGARRGAGRGPGGPGGAAHGPLSAVLALPRPDAPLAVAGVRAHAAAPVIALPLLAGERAG